MCRKQGLAAADVRRRSWTLVYTCAAGSRRRGKPLPYISELDSRTLRIRESTLM
jgi:hypothetical protein